MKLFNCLQEGIFVMKLEELKSLIIKNPISIKYDEFEIVLTSFIGAGSYNVVFLGLYNVNGVEKKSVIKFFLPDILFKMKNAEDYQIKNEVAMEYDFVISKNNDRYEINRILLAVPAQIELYKKALIKYQESNKQMIEMLNNSDLNSFVPTPFNEQIMVVDTINDNVINITNCIMCFEYSLSTSLKEYLTHCTDVVKRIEVVKSISFVLKKFYESDKNLLMLDLKIDNFLFKSNGDDVKLNNLYIIDWDSLVKVNSKGYIENGEEIHSSENISPTEILNNTRELIGAKSCIYMLGIMLYTVLLLPISTKEELDFLLSPADEYNDVEFNESVIDELKNMGVTHGFILKLIKVLTNSFNTNSNYRYNVKNGSNEFDQFLNDLNILIDIYNHKGIHPEVMLDKAIELSKDEDFFNQKDFDEKLLCEVEEAV